MPGNHVSLRPRPKFIITGAEVRFSIELCDALPVMAGKG